MTNNTDHTPPFDPLDMNNYHIEKLPKVQKTGRAVPPTHWRTACYPRLCAYLLGSQYFVYQPD